MPPYLPHVPAKVPPSSQMRVRRSVRGIQSEIARRGSSPDA